MLEYALGRNLQKLDDKGRNIRCSMHHPFIYDKSFSHNSGTCIFRRFLTCLNCSLRFSQLPLKFFKCLDNIQTLKNYLKVSELWKHRKVHSECSETRKHDLFIHLTGLGRSGSRKITRKICSTATSSFCSSNCIRL